MHCPLFMQKEEVLARISQLMEKRALESDPTEDGLALYRQQCSIVSRKKESCAERLNQLRQEVTSLETQLEVIPANYTQIKTWVH